MTIPFPIALHPAQQQVVDSAADCVVVAAGRRFGKSTLAFKLCWDVAGQGKTAYWVVPSLKMAQLAWRRATRDTADVAGVQLRRAELSLDFDTGGRIQICTVFMYLRLLSELEAGDKLPFVAFDEAAFIPYPPGLGALDKAAFLSTPKGNNWFRDLHASPDKEFHDIFKFSSRETFHFITMDNSKYSREAFEHLRREMPDVLFRQEYLAEFIDDAAVS